MAEEVHPCPSCGLAVDNLVEHIKSQPQCEAFMAEKFAREMHEMNERMRVEEPERYALIQRLRGLEPLSGTDPDFKYPAKQ